MPFVLLAQNQQELKTEIAKRFNQERIVKKIQPINEDSTLSKVAERMYQQGVFAKEVNKDEIRKMLREQRIYDYNIELVSVPIKKTKSNELKLTFDRKINSVVQDSNYNMYGIIPNNSNDADSIYVLFIQRYIYVNVVLKVIKKDLIKPTTRNPTVTLVFNIQTKMTDVFIEQISSAADINNVRFGRKITHEEFEPGLGRKLQPDVYPMSIKYNTGDIIFYDKNSKILTYIENHE